jgi:cell division protein FtsB
MLDLSVSVVMIVSRVRRACCGAGYAAPPCQCRVREALAARDAENAELRAAVRALSLQVAELQRRLG